MVETIYVKLLGEVDVWRSVLAEHIADDGSFLILPRPLNMVPSGEIWEFMPGTRVLTNEKTFEGKSVKVAYKVHSET